jgi:hypothetical protein
MLHTVPPHRASNPHTLLRPRVRPVPRYNKANIPNLGSRNLQAHSQAWLRRVTDVCGRFNPLFPSFSYMNDLWARLVIDCLFMLQTYIRRERAVLSVAS